MNTRGENVKKFEDPQYRFEDLDDDGSQFLVKVEIVPLDSVDISQDGAGEITVTPKQVPAEDTGNGKYRLEREGDMFRVYATRNIRDKVNEGARGGLVGSDRVLSAQGSCWISDGSKAHEGVRIRDDALITSSCDISGSVTISDNARLFRTIVMGDCVMIEGSVRIDTSRIVNSSGGDLNIRGYSHIYNSAIEPAGGKLLISGCNIAEAHVRNRYELLSAHSNSWGWLSAYRGKDGQWQFQIGCKTRYSVAALKELAEDMSNVSDLEREMLDHFLAMVEVSRRGWVDYVAPVTTAQQMRDAIRANNPPRTDQYGTELR